MSPFMHSSTHNKIREYNSAQSSHRGCFPYTAKIIWLSFARPLQKKKKKSTSQKGKKDLKLSLHSALKLSPVGDRDMSWERI